jgi:hypothetical protein
MFTIKHVLTRGLAAAALVATQFIGDECIAAEPPAAAPGEVEMLRREIEELKAQQRKYQKRIDTLSEKVEALETKEDEKPETVDASPSTPAPVQARLLDISMNILTAVGGSTVDGDDLESLDAGAHDPNRNGFTLQQAELSITGAVDPYLRGEVHVVATPDGVELEEAFLTTTALPAGLQLEAGYFLTEFGILNPRHAHAWDWLDQPVILTRLMGDEALRAPGARVGWLTPLPWYSEVHLGVQNADEGDLTTSFIGDGALGRPAVDRDVNGPEDLLWLARWVNSFDPGDETTAVWGLSGLYGPNDTSNGADTWIYGTDLKVRWRPRSNFRGWPFLLWQTEILGRSYDAAASTDPAGPLLPKDTLEDFGGYTQILWGFRPGWAAGARYEYASASGDSTIDDVLESHDDDPLRDERHRFSPLLVWHPTHFSRLRLQYNYDRARHLDQDDAHTVWLGAEILYGEHGAHDY